MGSATSLDLHDGRLVVIKQASDLTGVQRLRREAACLRSLTHPGVVELVAFDDHHHDGDDGVAATGHGAVLRTAYVGGGALSQWPLGGGGPDQVFEVCASLTATLADLHHRGATHGRISADHVLVAADGRAVLCSFAGATVEPGGAGDQSAKDGDVQAVGLLLQALAGSRPEPTLAALAGVAERALAPDAQARPSMRALAEALDGLAHGARPRTDGPRDGKPRNDAVTASPRSGDPGRILLPRPASDRTSRVRSQSGRRRVVVGAGAVVLVAAAVSGLTGTGATHEPQGTLALPSGAAPSPERSTTSGPGFPPEVAEMRERPERIPGGDGQGVVRVWPPPSCPSEGEELVADVDGDGCLDEIGLEAGVVRVAGRRWQVAGPHDVVVVGDWDCDGVATPAVLRPGSGEVWHYDRWAGDGEKLSSVLVRTVPGAVDLGRPATRGTDRPGPQGCDRLAVLDVEGVTTVIDPAAASRP